MRRIAVFGAKIRSSRTTNAGRVALCESYLRRVYLRTILWRAFTAFICPAHELNYRSWAKGTMPPVSSKKLMLTAPRPRDVPNTMICVL